jgi:hypothetical protein
MTRFWRTLCLLVLGLALGLGAPLRALAALPVPMLQDESAMPCHGEVAATPTAADPISSPDCPHCSHGQSGWGCGHCAGCLLGAALAAQSATALSLVEAGGDHWTPRADAAARPLALAVPTPPPKATAVR